MRLWAAERWKTEIVGAEYLLFAEKEAEKEKS